MAYDWLKLSQKKRYDQYGNEIDEDGNIINGLNLGGDGPGEQPSQQAPAPTPAQSFIAHAPDMAVSNGSAAGGVLDAVGSGVSTLGPWGAVAGTALKVAGGLMNNKEKEDSAAEAERQKRRDMNTEQQRLDQAERENRYRSDQASGARGIDWLSSQADTAHKRRNDYRSVFAAALGR